MAESADDIVNVNLVKSAGREQKHDILLNFTRNNFDPTPLPPFDHPQDGRLTAGLSLLRVRDRSSGSSW